MTILLKIRRKALETETRLTRLAERHHRDCGRKLTGWYSKKHKKDNPKPTPPEPQALKKAKEEDREHLIDEHYLKMWNLTDYRKRQLQYEARHLHLVRGFLKGQAYKDIEEQGTYHHPDETYLFELAQEYSDVGDNILKDKFVKWWDEAHSYIRKMEKVKEEIKEILAKKSKAA